MIDAELPLWGGFYAGERYNFVITGQKNTKDLIRLMKYLAGDGAGSV